MSQDIPSAVRSLCLGFPETEEVPSRGSPDFRVAGKTFATFVVNHHGDGRVALWLRALPEACEGEQFGTPVWRAGRKTFCCVHHRAGRLCLQFWVGPEEQAMLTYDASRYRIPPYIGHRGWIELDVEDDIDWDEVQSLALKSYRHFALKRMLARLDGG